MNTLKCNFRFAKYFSINKLKIDRGNSEELNEAKQVEK